MSEFEKGKDMRQKKYYPVNKDKKDGHKRLQIILAKPERDVDRDKGSTKPTIILRNRAVSPSQRPATVLRKDSETQQPPLYQLAAKHTTGENVNPLSPPPEMKGSVKLVDESFQFCDGALEFLLDQNDFMVVGCLGLQGVGKSTLMSLLAGNQPDDPPKSLYFKPQGLEHHELGGHCTTGVDLLVTPNRVILLDTQPMLSASVMDRLVQQESKKFAGTEFTSTENAMEIQSLQLAAFLLSVCHIVILVQDWFFDPNFLRFVQSAEMLKPSTPTTSQDEEIIEYFPHVLFLQNRAATGDFSPSQLKLMQTVYSRTCLRSRLQTQSGIGNTVSPQNSGDATSLFLLPDFGETEEAGHYRGHPGFAELLAMLRNQIHGVTCHPITHTVLSEKNWLHYASKVWEGVKKSSFFMEYSRLLP
ncbi:nonsense-mediated mRNA decay factor SMG9 [Periplaneta americana]|uniref:nonsense-mediated mRNA decay factor SMG9 n=1 Tax=Periplaneta americana TaxID=6978 RepID=UPI0037E82C60